MMSTAVSSAAVASTSGAAYTIFGQKFVPALLDYYLARTGYKSQQTGAKVGPDRPNNLWEPVDGDGGPRRR